MKIEETLAERGKVYGDYHELANIAQSLKEVMHNTEGWKNRLSHTHMEALDLVATKIARILNGDPCYQDNWHDASAYLELGRLSCEGD